MPHISLVVMLSGKRGWLTAHHLVVLVIPWHSTPIIPLVADRKTWQTIPRLSCVHLSQLQVVL